MSFMLRITVEHGVIMKKTLFRDLKTVVVLNVEGNSHKSNIAKGNYPE